MCMHKKIKQVFGEEIGQWGAKWISRKMGGKSGQMWNGIFGFNLQNVRLHIIYYLLINGLGKTNAHLRVKTPSVDDEWICFKTIILSTKLEILLRRMLLWNFSTIEIINTTNKPKHPEIWWQKMWLRICDFWKRGDHHGESYQKA